MLQYKRGKLERVRRSLRGNVDRNNAIMNSSSTRYSVVPYVGTWIEIFCTQLQKITYMSFPTWERG